jgi:cytochrome c biogenesis protein CcdA
MAKTSTFVIYGGSGASILGALTPGDWQIIGVVGGILLGLAGFAVNVWFKWQHLKLARDRAGVMNDI